MKALPFHVFGVFMAVYVALGVIVLLVLLAAIPPDPDYAQ
jgi:hypothetical protein